MSRTYTSSRRWPKRLLKVVVAATAAVVLVWLLMLLLMWRWVADPPSLPPEAAAFTPTVEQRGDRLYAGKSWYGRREGLPVLYLTGTPYEMGYANGLLTQALIKKQEESMLNLLNRYAPSKLLQFVLKFVVVFKNRKLPDHIIAEHQLEILGLSRGCPDAHPEQGPYYHRLLNYHGAQDISYMLMNSPLLRRGCTAFGAWGNHTQEGHLMTGRNFDWEADPVFDQDRVLVYCEPDRGIGFISLAWAGMAGCVSGLNREGVSISVNGAPSHLPQNIGTPTCLIAREVLQCASNLGEAIEILRRREVFVSSLFLVGSRADGKFVVVEKTPERTEIREPGEAQFIVCANHYLTPELENDELNEVFKRDDTSLPRYERMRELLTGKAAPLSGGDIASILRDRRLPGGEFPGNGHRSSLNPLIATHSVIMDLTEGIFWAAAPPHQLGRFIPFKVGDFDQALPEKTIAEDRLLADDGYKNFLAAKAQLEDGWNALKRKDYALAVECARAGETNNPGFYANAWLLAEALFHQGKTNEAAGPCRAALAGKPALGGERRKLEDLAKRLGIPTE